MLGIQLFGCMDYFNADPGGFLSRLSAMGYGLVEPCILIGEGHTDRAWSAERVSHYARQADGQGLGLDSAHVFTRDILAAVPALKRVAQESPITKFVVGIGEDFSREALDAFAQKCAQASDALRQDGLELWLHNSWREIAAKLDGLSAYEYVLRACEGKLGAQVDTGWVVCGGEDLNSFLSRNESCIRSIHHKDIASLPDESGNVVNVALGRGIASPAVAYKFAAKRGLSQLVDQDSSAGDLMDDLAQSAALLRSFGTR